MPRRTQPEEQVCDRTKESVDGNASSDTDEAVTRSSWAWRREEGPKATVQATRSQMRAAAHDGLLVEDLLRRIEFDDSFSAEDFTAYVARGDPSAVSPSSLWCSEFSWSGRCNYGTKCWYSHEGTRLAMWGGAREKWRMLGSAMAPLAEIPISEAMAGPSFAVMYVLFKGSVVWARDLGSFGAELWNRFVNNRNECESDPEAAACVCDLPSVCLERVVRCLTIAEVVPTALALGHAVDWTAVMDERWPAPACSEASTCVDSPVAALASLVESSRLAAQLLRLPPRDASASTSAASTSSSPQPSTPGQTPLTPGQTPLTPGTGLTAEMDLLPPGVSTACSAVWEWLGHGDEPNCVRNDSEVTSISLDKTLLVTRSCNGELRVIRRTDLKQITSVRIKDALSLDVAGETLVVGTFAPARLMYCDLSSSQTKVNNQIKLEAKDGKNKNSSVVQTVLQDEETCMCCLARDDQPLGLEVVVVDLRNESLKLGSRLDCVGFAPWVNGCLTAAPDGKLSVWDVSSNGFTPKSEISFVPSGRSPVHVACHGGRFVAAAAPDHADAPVIAHDMRSPSTPLRVADLANFSLGLAPATGSAIESFAEDSSALPAFRWRVELLHVEGPLLVVLARALPGQQQFSLETADDDDAELRPPPVGPKLFAWNLPTCRPVLAGHPSLPITAFGCCPEGGRIAFACRPRGTAAKMSNASSFVVVPGAGAVKRGHRKAGLQGPINKKKNESSSHDRRHMRRLGR